LPWTAAGFADEFRIWIESALAQAGDLAPIVRARAFASAATVASAQGDWPAQLEYSDQSLELYAALGDDEGIALSLVGRGNALQNLGRTEEARETLAEALRMARLASSRPVLLGAGQAFAFLALEERDFDLALSLAAELDEVEKKDWPISELILGLVALEKGEPSEARRLLATAVAQSHELLFQYALAFDLEALAAALVACDDVERAVVLAGQAGAMRDALGAEPESYERTLRARVAEAGRRELGDERFRAAITRGGRMSADEAVELALGDA
jgi:tetratricopeptide (TPR) repeat protein